MARQDLRVVEVLTLTRAAREEVVGVLDANELEYVLTDESGGDSEMATISFPLPTQTVEHIQTRLEELDIDDELYTIVIDPEAVVSDRFGDSDDPYDEVRGLGYQGISRSELISTATDMVPDRTIYLLMTAISAVVATAGVLLNSLSVLVGSMVIAPLIGPLMATSVATVLDEPNLYRRSVRYQIQGGAVALASAIGFATIVKFTDLVDAGFNVSHLLQVSSHTAPNFLLVVVALGAGFAGALSLSTSGTIDLVGVMIAAAVMPPIGVVGVGVAWVSLSAVVGGVAVVLMNVFSMTLAAIISLWYLGYHPESMADVRRARGTMLVRISTLGCAIVALVILLARVTNSGLTEAIPLL
ncbi:TIGR00341 family protein [Halobacteria archaeon HArc-gm2]|nr:TIGR00341 family protein [Halobacteria archaeon HArc-gm2]